MNGHHPIRNLGDLGASLAGVLAIASHIAVLLQPLATFVLTMMGIAWWSLRFIRFRKTDLWQNQPHDFWEESE